MVKRDGLYAPYATCKYNEFLHGQMPSHGGALQPRCSDVLVTTKIAQWQDGSKVSGGFEPATFGFACRDTTIVLHIPSSRVTGHG